MSEHTVEKDARCSRCDEVVGTVVTERSRATIRLSTDSHGTDLPITCPNVTPPAEPCDHDTLGCGWREDHEAHSKAGDGRPCCGWPPRCRDISPGNGRDQ